MRDFLDSLFGEFTPLVVTIVVAVLGTLLDKGRKNAQRRLRLRKAARHHGEPTLVENPSVSQKTLTHAPEKYINPEEEATVNQPMEVLNDLDTSKSKKEYDWKKAVITSEILKPKFDI